MIFGIGTDLTEVGRIAEKIDRNQALLRQLFAENEILYCEAQQNKAEHYAARFAAKEAFLKASGQGLMLGYELADIEICHNVDGQPHILLHGNFKKQAADSGWKRIHLSLTHVKDMACAFVVIEI